VCTEFVRWRPRARCFLGDAVEAVANAVGDGLTDALTGIRHRARASAKTVRTGELLGQRIDLGFGARQTLGIVPLRSFGALRVQLRETRLVRTSGCVVEHLAT
jgi:hypothetical protein